MTDPDRTRATPTRADGEPIAGSGSVERGGVAGLPELVGRYRIVSLLGEGGFGRVYRGTDPALNRDVAIKVPLRASLTEDARERFIREAHAAANIHHANVCPIYDVGSDGDVPFLVMRFVGGGTLADLLAGRQSNLPLPLVIAVARKLALGVAAAHLVGVIHRDLKPQNVLWDEANKQVLVTDFGLARFEGGPALTPDRQVCGTPAYMAPEQAEGESSKVGPLSDVYSLGVILYELLAGRPPFLGTVYEVLWKVTQESPPPPSKHRPGLDSELEAICLRAMARSPGSRFSSARALADALGAYMTDRASGQRDTGMIDAPEPLELPGDPVSNTTTDVGVTATSSDASSGREVVVCPDCDVRLEVSKGRTQLIHCPRCQSRFAPEVGRDAARRPVRPAIDPRRAHPSRAADRPGADHSPSPATGPNWTPAICGLLLSWLGIIVATSSSLLAGVLENVARYRATPGPSAPDVFPMNAAEPVDGIPFAVRFAPVIGLGLAASGRWLVASVPRPSRGGVAARIAAVLMIAATVAGVYGLVAEEPPGARQAPDHSRPLTGIAAVLILGVMSEVALTYYFTAIGRHLGAAYPRRAVKALRTGAIYLLLVLGVAVIGVVVVRGGGYSDRVKHVGTGLAVVFGCIAALVLIVALYRTLSVHLRAVAEMWHDAHGGLD